MRKLLIIVLLITGGSYFFFSTEKGTVIKNTALTYITSPSYIHKMGATVDSRIVVPENFSRASYAADSFSAYIQQYHLLPFDAEVINYDGKPYFYQQGHVGVLDVPVPSNGLQQCADALIRLRAEYLWQHNRKDEIAFNFTSGHRCSWISYAEGYRPKINGNKVSFHRTASANHSEENFYRYLNLMYTYSGTQSLFDELPKITSLENIEVGDMLIQPGFPGHVMMVVDKATSENDSILFIFAQGNTPAQSVHILKNPNDAVISPWFEITLGQPLMIPTYHFDEIKIMRFN